MTKWIAVAMLAVLALAFESQAAEKVPPPGLYRGVMTDDIRTLTFVRANCCLLWGPPGKPAVWDTLAEEKIYPLMASLGGDNKAFFELDGKKRVKMTTPYCWSNDFGAWWVQHVAEGAAKKYPAMCCVTPDEFQWNNGILPYLFHVPQPVGTKFYCECDKCKAAVGKLPAITASRFLDDSPESRAFIRYRYEATAKAMKDSLDAAKKADPEFLSCFDLNLKEVMNYERYPAGIALDMLPQADVLLATCFQTSCDRRGDETRFIPAITTKHLLAARPRIGALPCLAATVYDYRKKQDWTQDYYWRKEVEAQLPQPAIDSIRKDLAPYELRDDEVVLPSISCLAHGAKGVMYFGEDARDGVKKVFALMAKLEKPLEGATVPGEVIVLVSRTSEDEWMLSHAPKVGPHDDLTDAMVQSGCWAQPADRIAWEFTKDAECSQGLRSSQSVMQALIRQGIPFRMCFVETLEEADVAQAKRIFVPFCSHLSDKAAALLSEDSARKKELVFEHRGEFNEAGVKRAAPVFEKTRAFSPVEAWKYFGMAGLRKDLPEILGVNDVFDVHAACPSEDVERAWLKTADGGVALFLINWSDKEQTVIVRLPGAAKAALLDLTGKSSEVPPICAVHVNPRDARVLLQPGAKP